jgi:hypothetical protein
MSTAIENAPAGHDSIRWQRDIPLRYKADVAVIGGGIAGVCAACAAAAEGASVILVERFAVTGGNATIGGVANWAGETHGQGAIFDEIIAKQEEWKSIEPYPGPYEHYSPRSRRVFDHDVLAVILQEMLLAYGVKLLLHTRLVDAMHEGRRVGPALLAGASGLEGLDAKVFVDASGGAELARAAGCTMLPEGQYGPLPASIEFFVREMPQDEAVAGGDGGGAPTVEPQLPAGWFSPVRRREDLPMTSPWPNGPDGVALKVKVIGHHSGDTEELTALEIAARRRQWEVLDYFQTQEKKPWRMDHTSPIIALRETRRIAGDYVLTVDDLRAGRAFDDAVAKGYFYLDGMRPDDEKRTYLLSKEEQAVPPYHIPYRSLVARDADNLLMAGRCMSADQLALSSARTMTTCAMMGQAAGTAAAWAANGDLTPRDIHTTKLRKHLEDRGADLSLPAATEATL